MNLPDLRKIRADAVALALVVACGAWSFWPVLRRLVVVWESEPDYGHGYLVPLVAAAILWLRRARRPAATADWRGLVFVVSALALLIAGGTFYLAVLQDVALLLWVAGACWLIGGRALVRWASPAIGFLAFMLPMPFRLEQLVTLPMQHVATQWSAWLLQCWGLPALAEGNVLLIDETRLEVAQACSGLRMFMCVVAVAYVYAVLARKPRWLKITLFAFVAPVAMVANTLRISATAIAWQYVISNGGREWIHDVAGWLMIPLAVALLHLILWYFDRVSVPVEVLDATQLLRRGRGPAPLKHAT
ncbi:MAG TPA: exosortase/archaeosortase family protein [Pirellulales bacterium]|nr:exosortase/archaeosortase family protein [Pirellulales bacterium]